MVVAKYCRVFRTAATVSSTTIRGESRIPRTLCVYVMYYVLFFFFSTQTYNVVCARCCRVKLRVAAPGQVKTCRP
jgi:hypothetical protein